MKDGVYYDFYGILRTTTAFVTIYRIWTTMDAIEWKAGEPYDINNLSSGAISTKLYQLRTSGRLP